MSEIAKKLLSALGIREPASDEEMERRAIQNQFREETGFERNFTRPKKWLGKTIENEYTYKETPPPLNFPYVEVTGAPNVMQDNYSSAETERFRPVVATPYGKGEFPKKFRRHEQEHVNQQYSGDNMDVNYEPADVREAFGGDEIADYLSYRMNPREMAAWQAGDPGSDAGWDKRLWEDMAKRFIGMKGSKTPTADLIETVRNKMSTRKK